MLWKFFPANALPLQGRQTEGQCFRNKSSSDRYHREFGRKRFCPPQEVNFVFATFAGITRPRLTTSIATIATVLFTKRLLFYSFPFRYRARKSVRFVY